ncbi:MAG: MBL fold metallo-hydrolase [Bradymonadaceae bacterium]
MRTRRGRHRPVVVLPTGRSARGDRPGNGLNLDAGDDGVSSCSSRRPTAAAVPLRTDGPLRVLWSKRPDDRSFLGGFHAFVTGRVEPRDTDVPVAGSHLQRHVACAARELFEEAGLVASTDGPILAPAESPNSGRWEAARRDLRRGGADFADLLRGRGTMIDGSAFVPLGDWPSPAGAPLDTRTEFFALPLDDGPLDRLPDRMGPEHRSAEWIRPSEALARWQSGRALLSPPILRIVRALASEGWSPLDPVRLEGPGSRAERETFEPVRGIRFTPLKTRTTVPGGRTNCYTVGRRRVLIVDPGSAFPSEQQLLKEAIRGLEPRAVVLTHAHRDHVAGVAALAGDRALPVWAHSRAAERLPVDVDRCLGDGDRLDLDGKDELRVLHTPGHAPGHLCLHHARTGSALVGDLLRWGGTVVIDPSEGSLADYLESLRRLRAPELDTVFPAHGPPITDPSALVDAYIEHRRARERAVLDALHRAPGPADAIVLLPTAYADAPRRRWPLALHSLRAHLDHLCDRGLARRTPRGYRPT